MACQGRGLKRGHAHTPCPTLSRSHCLRLHRTGQFGNRSQFVLQLILQCYQIWHFKKTQEDFKKKENKKRLFTINIFCLSSLTLNLRLCSKKKPKKALKKAPKRSKKKKQRHFVHIIISFILSNV